MAAGLGTRLRPFTEVTAKPLLPLMGVPIAQFSWDLLMQSGVKNIVANVSHLASETAQGLARLERGDTSLKISDESALLLGSGGGIKKASPYFGDRPFYLLNSDVLCDVDLTALSHQHAKLRKKHGVTLTLAILKSGQSAAKYREIHVDPETHLISALGEPVQGRPYFIGVAIIEPEALKNIPDGVSDFVTSILLPALSEGKAGALLMEACNWYDIGSPELWHATHLSLIEMLENGRIPSLWKKRIEQVSEKVLPRAWVAKGFSRTLLSPGWQPPFYVAIKENSPPIRSIGPETILYKEMAADLGSLGLISEEYRYGIGYQGLWQNTAGHLK